MKKPTEKMTHAELCRNVAKLEKREVTYIKKGIISLYRLDVMVSKMENLRTIQNYMYQRIFSLENQVSTLIKSSTSSNDEESGLGYTLIRLNEGIE